MDITPPTKWQARVMWLALTGLAVAVLVGLVAGLVWGLSKVVQVLAPVLWPLAVAGVLAYLLDPVVDWIEHKGRSRRSAIVIVFAGAMVIIAALFGSVVPQVITETRQLANRIPDYANRLVQRFDYWISNPPPWARKLIERELGVSNAPVNVTATDQTSLAGPTNAVAGTVTNAPPPAVGVVIAQQDLQKAAGWFAQGLREAGPWLWSQVGRVASWFGMLAGLALIPVYAFYFLLEKRGISSNWTDYLPVANSRFKQELVFMLNSTNNYLIAFFRGQVLVALSDGILYGLGFLIIGLPYAVLIGAAAVFLTMIPFLGAIVTCSAALIISVVQFGDWLHPLLVLAVFGCVQALEGLVISPKIMGDRVGLHPVIIIIAVMAGTTLLGGLLGGILAIPLTAALRVAMSRYIWKKPVVTRETAARDAGNNMAEKA